MTNGGTSSIIKPPSLHLITKNMKKNTVKLNENALRKIVAESIKKALKEGIGDETMRGLFGNTPEERKRTFSDIDAAFQERGIDAYVSKFFSDENQVMIMVKGHENDGEVKDIMSQFGYGQYVGQGIDWLQFRKGDAPVKVSGQMLESVITECVVKAINEISAGMLDRAAEKASSLGRNSQADAFATERDNRVRDEFNNPSVNATAKSISYRGKNNTICLISADGNYAIRPDGYFRDGTKTQGRFNTADMRIPSELKVKDKSIARLIAKWWASYGPQGNGSETADWHTFFDWD